MALFHSSGNSAALGSNPAVARPAPGKRRMSMFSFGSSPSSQSKSQSLPPISTSPSSVTQSQKGSKPHMARSQSYVPPKQAWPHSPSGSPVFDSCTDVPNTHIFERSVQDSCGYVKPEDCMSPALDATAQILSDSKTDLDDVEMVYSPRRNSSVVGLNMALGRTYTPSRKNSVYSVPQMMSATNSMNTAIKSSGPATTSQTSSSNLSAPWSGGGSQQSKGSNPQAQSPVSPPKLLSSRSSLSFYSYADMINNDEFSRRPSLLHVASQGGVPTVGRKTSVTSSQSNGYTSATSKGPFDPAKFTRKSSQSALSPSHSQSQLSKQMKDRHNLAMTQIPTSKAGEDSSLKKFLISPESSDSEDQEEVYHPAMSSRESMGRRKSTASSKSFGNRSINDNESLVSTSAGECIRQCNTELSGI